MVSEYCIAVIGLAVSIVSAIMSVILFWQIMLNGQRDKINQNQFNDLKKYVYAFFEMEFKRVFVNHPGQHASFMESINETFNIDFDGRYDRNIVLAYRNSGLNPNIAKNDSNWFFNKKNKELLLRFAILNYMEFANSHLEPYRIELGSTSEAINYIQNKIYDQYKIKPIVPIEE